IENRGRTISKDDLIKAVWNGTFVTDNALTRVIAQLRRELGDDAKQPKYIETVPTVGYRFVAELKSVPRQTRWKSPPSSVTAATGGGLAVLLVVLFLKVVPHGDAPAVSVARMRSIRQFTVSAGVDQHPSFSPDGASIAFSSDRTGRFEVYVQPL